MSTTFDDLDPKLPATLADVEARLAAGADIASASARALATRAAEWDEQLEWREAPARGGGFVAASRGGAYEGAGERCAALLALLIDRGLPDARTLLHVGPRCGPVAEVLVRKTDPRREDVDAALRAMVQTWAFGPNPRAYTVVLAAGPSVEAASEALMAATRAMTYARRDAAPPPHELDLLEKMLDAGANASRGAGEPEGTALHHFVRFAPPPPPVMANAKPDKRTARVDAMLTRALATVEHPDMVDGAGSTPLHIAVALRIPSRARMLLDAGADPKRADNEGRTPKSRADGMFDKELDAMFGIDRTPKPKAAPAPPPADPFAVGAAVTHKKFGPGKVVTSEGTGEARKLTVAFDSGEKKTLAASFLSPG